MSPSLSVARDSCRVRVTAAVIAVRGEGGVSPQGPRCGDLLQCVWCWSLDHRCLKGDRGWALASLHLPLQLEQLPFGQNYTKLSQNP